MKTRISVVAIALVLAACAAAQAYPIAYLCDASNQFGRYDIASGTFTLIGSTSVTMMDIAVSPYGKVYGADAAGNLYEINAYTAADTFVANLGFGPNALDFRSDGTLFAAGGSDLYSVNAQSGVSTYIGSFGPYTSSGDLAFDANGKLCLSTATNDLVKLDPTNASAGIVGPIGFSGVFGMDLAADGQMYGFSATYHEIIKIDTCTGQGLFVASLAGTGLQWVNGAAMPYETVPEPSSLIALVSGLAGLGMMIRYRK